MSLADDFTNDGDGEQVRRYVRIGALVLVFALLAGGVWYLMNDTTGVHKPAPRVQTILATLPPPPPPPPKQEKPPEPEKKIEEAPKPSETPKQVDAPKPMTINGPAQAGNDAFNIGAGEGGGMVASGGGIGDGSYGLYMGSALQRFIQQNDRVNRLVFSAEVAVWVDASGRLTQVKILKSSGDDKTDQLLVSALDGMPGLDQPPPGSMQFPQRVAIRGRKMG